MNKLEEYKRSLLIKAKVNHNNNETNGFYTKGIRKGFDAAIALDLAVKFEKWIMETSTGSIGDKHVCKDLATKLGRESKLFTVEDLHSYWLDNILKLE